MLVKSAGNRGRTDQYITAPGKAWNVLAVGAVDLATDSIADYSSWINPTSATGAVTNREKPELVAPGGPFYMYDINNMVTTISRTGTSYAAPQVTGLAAMVSQVDRKLTLLPEAIRAILLASANTNIEGLAGIPHNGVTLVGDLKDGAGQIQADRAVKIAETFYAIGNETPCTEACWWYKTTGNPEPDIVRYFIGMKGQRVRVAIAWWSNADNDANDYSFDRLDTNFDLRIEYQQADGSWLMPPLGSSQSDDNNFELLDVPLPVDGNYRIVVSQTAVQNNERMNIVGIAMALVHNVYLPTISAK